MGVIRNIKLSDLLLLVAKLNCEYKVMDVVFDEEDNAIRFHPLGEIEQKNTKSKDEPEGPSDREIENLESLF